MKILLNERGHLIATDRLIEYLWPDLPIEKAQNNLWVTISQARRTLQPELKKRGESNYIQRSAEGYSFILPDNSRLDVEAFTEALKTAQSAGSLPARLKDLEAARKLYSGDYLEEDPYEEWALATREELREIFLSLLIDLAGASAQAGRYRRAIALCREILSKDPSREAAYQKLMTYHYSAGEHAQAVKVYEECRRALSADLGVEPSPATRRIFEQIQRRELDAADGNPPFPQIEEEAASIESLTATEFVGRSAELSHLIRLVDQLFLGRGQAVLIEGEPGIGKSRLVQELGRHARQRSLRSLSVSCYQIEQTTPFQPIVELIDQAQRAWSQRIFDNLPPASLAEIAALYPEAARLSTGLPSPPSGLDEARQARLFKALTDLIINAAGREGLALVIDDIHWADPATLHLIHNLARQAARYPILLAATYRGEEAAVNEELSTFIHSLKREPGFMVLRLNRLSIQDVERILEPMAPVEQQSEEDVANSRLLANWLHQETDGIPFFLVTILQSLIEQGLIMGDDRKGWDPAQPVWMEAEHKPALPDALLDSVRARLSRVPKTGREALEAAAVIGRRFEFNTLQAATQAAPVELLETLEDLLRRGLLKENEDGQHYDFSHDKIREVVYRDLSQARRAYLHRRAAEVIHALKTAEEEEYAGTLAEHYLQGQDWRNAILAMRTAGDRSRRLFAIREAIQFYDRALQLAHEHPEVIEAEIHPYLHQQRGEARIQTGEFEGAVSDLEQSLAARREAGNREREQELLVALGILYRRGDQLKEASEYLHQALEAARELGDNRRAADTLYNLGTVLWSQGENLQAERYHQEAVDICRHLGLRDVIAAQAIHGLGEARWIAGDFLEAYQLFHESLDLSRQIGDLGLENENLHNLGALHSDELAANYRKAGEYLQRSLQILSDTGLAWHQMPTLFILGLVTGSMGDYERGIKYIQQSLQESQRLKTPRYHATALDFLGCLYRDLNLLPQAEQAHHEGLKTTLNAGVEFWAPRLQANLAIDRLRQGRLEVETDLLEALRLSRRRGQGIHAALCLQGLCELTLKKGEALQALEYAAELAGLAAYGMQEALTQAHRFRGEALAVQGERAEAEAALLQAVELASKIEKPRLAWEIHSTLGRIYASWGAQETAQEHHRKAATALVAIQRKLRSPALSAGIKAMAAENPPEYLPPAEH